MYLIRPRICKLLRDFNFFTAISMVNFTFFTVFFTFWMLLLFITHKTRCGLRFQKCIETLRIDLTRQSFALIRSAVSSYISILLDNFKGVRLGKNSQNYKFSAFCSKSLFRYGGITSQISRVLAALKPPPPKMGGKGGGGGGLFFRFQ